MERRSTLAGLLLAATGLVGSAASTGAVTPAGTTDQEELWFVGNLTAAQVVNPPGSASTATGSARVRMIVDYPDDFATIITDLSWQGLGGSADRSHMHTGQPGTPRDEIYQHEILNVDSRTVIPCDWDNGGFDNCAPTTGSTHDENEISGGTEPDCPSVSCIVDLAIPFGFFVDLHTQQYPSGEIRGQLVYTPPRPDLRMKPASSATWTGDGAYKLDARKQTLNGSGRAGRTVTYQVAIENDHPVFDDGFTVVAYGPAVKGYSVRIFKGTKDVTAAIQAGTFQTRQLAPGGTVVLTVKVTIASTATAGSSIGRTFVATSTHDPNRMDVAKLVTARS